MKTLSMEQMENTKAGKFLSCASQVTGGMGVLVAVASIGIFALGPVGWIGFGFSVASLAFGAASDPNACDF
jgi:hypothetical protein